MSYFSNIYSITKLYYSHRSLILEMIKREVFGRYREQFGGLAWAFLNPLIMLGIYTFFFSMVFKAKWGDAVEENYTSFALVLFAGLIAYGFFSECISRSTGLIIGNVNYVKKVVFPLEILPGIAIGSALFHASLSLLILVAAQLITVGSLPWTIIFLPFIILPLIVLTFGISWFLSATGVYIRDISQIVAFMLPILLFVSPIFCPISAFPPKFHSILYLNPISFIVEELRNSIIFGLPPRWPGLGLYYGVSFVVAALGLTWFKRIRVGFADVL